MTKYKESETLELKESTSELKFEESGGPFRIILKRPKMSEAIEYTKDLGKMRI